MQNPEQTYRLRAPASGREALAKAKRDGVYVERETGVVLHMVSALAVAGRIGLTAIDDTLEGARARYYEVKAAVDEAAAELAPRRVG